MPSSDFVKFFRVKSHEVVFMVVTDDDEEDGILAFCRISGKTYETDVIGIETLSDITKGVASAVYNSLVQQIGEEEGDVIGGDTDS